MLLTKKRFHVKDLLNQLHKTLSMIVQMEPKKIIKHIELGRCVKHKTRSRKLITWIKFFGHCISHHEVNLVETDLVEE